MLTEQTLANFCIKMVTEISRDYDYLIAHLLLMHLNQTKFMKVGVELEN